MAIGVHVRDGGPVGFLGKRNLHRIGCQTKQKGWKKHNEQTVEGWGVLTSRGKKSAWR
jgi:hypothetical protein